MRVTPLVVSLLPALAAAQGQIALGDQVKGWFQKAKSFIPSAAPANEAQEVSQKVTAKIPEKTVTNLTLDNWRSVLDPSSQAGQEWLVYNTGGNKSCFGRCARPDEAFKESVPLFAVDPTSPQLAILDCEKEAVLCAIWAAAPPSVWHFQFPQVQIGEERPTIPLHVVYLNHTTVTPETIYQIHSEKTYTKVAPYDGALHPFDGWLARFGLNVPLGYVMYAFGAVPSWLMMVIISFVSRTMVTRRLQNPGRTAGRNN